VKILEICGKTRKDEKRFENMWKYVKHLKWLENV
jgi:hypothetical protein